MCPLLGDSRRVTTSRDCTIMAGVWAHQHQPLMPDTHVILENSARHRFSGDPLPLSFHRIMLILSKNTEPACHSAILKGLLGSGAATCPTATKLVSSTVRVCFPALIFHCGSCGHCFYFCRCFKCPPSSSALSTSTLLLTCPLPLALVGLHQFSTFLSCAGLHGHCRPHGSFPSGQQSAGHSTTSIRLWILSCSGLAAAAFEA